MHVNFNLNEWFKLAEEDQEAFEAEREKLLSQFIESGCNKRQLSGLQFRINMERRRAKNPLDACIRISKMMNEQFYHEFCPTISGIKIGEETSANTSSPSAKIIPFKKPE